jgi:hypothetical protein
VLFAISVRLNSTLRQHTAEIRLRPPVHKCNTCTAVQKYRSASILLAFFSANQLLQNRQPWMSSLLLALTVVQISRGAPPRGWPARILGTDAAISLNGGSTARLCDMKGAAFRPIQAR